MLLSLQLQLDVWASPLGWRRIPRHQMWKAQLALTARPPPCSATSPTSWWALPPGRHGSGAHRGLSASAALGRTRFRPRPSGRWSRSSCWTRPCEARRGSGGSRRSLVAPRTSHRGRASLKALLMRCSMPTCPQAWTLSGPALWPLAFLSWGQTASWSTSCGCTVGMASSLRAHQTGSNSSMTCTGHSRRVHSRRSHGRSPAMVVHRGLQLEPPQQCADPTRRLTAPQALMHAVNPSFMDADPQSGARSPTQEHPGTDGRHHN
mmetsp:Transcript_18143/g.51456  ORF Transcript_18143/g.51456 Transcript_18143/m.51456 type:complete len:263 (+) Transcript_18143:234-1022(+)